MTTPKKRRGTPRPGNGGPRANSGGKRSGSGATRRKVMLSEDNARTLRRNLRTAYTEDDLNNLVNAIVAEWLARGEEQG